MKPEHPEKISSRDIDIQPADICLVFCIRDEAFRLPFFLEYYRQIGVKHFLAIDNDSTDGTQEFLLQQIDVHLFHTNQIYKASNAGRDWTSWVADQYCPGNWVLTLDVDEFLVYPEMEIFPLRDLISYLEYSKFEGLFSIFLDFYSDVSLSKSVYDVGDSPFEVCPFFDGCKNYIAFENEIFPYLDIRGGPRQRVFWSGQGAMAGPSMRKIALVKWKKGFAYSHSTHSCTPLKLADITGALAHFKLLSNFKSHAFREVERKARTGYLDWKVYRNFLNKEDPVFFEATESIRFKSSATLVDNSIIRSSENYRIFVQKNTIEAHYDSPKTTNVFNSVVDYQSAMSLWPVVSKFSRRLSPDGKEIQSLIRLEKDLDSAVDSKLWRSTYYLRKYASHLGYADPRSVTEENYHNQSLHARFVYVYKSIWWDLLGPARLIYRLFNRFFR